MVIGNIDLNENDIQKIVLELIKKNSRFRFVHLGSNLVTFAYVKDNIIEKYLTIHIGIEKIRSNYFMHKIPTEYEIESAINNIEDELMTNSELVNQGQKLILKDKIFIDIFDIADGEQKEFLRQDIEDVFSKYALLSMGRSSVYDGVKMDHEKYAGLLILREIVHHLSFKEVLIDNT